MSRRTTYGLTLIILLVGGLMNGIYAQSRYDSAFALLAKRYPENLVVFTDRSLYAVNESILFSALLQSGEEPYGGLGSNVLYAELVNSAGEALVKGKYLLSENRSAGHLSIPPSLLSGTYYLRCYTRWMRNFGPCDFAYLPIRVVNPYSTDVMEEITASEKNDLSVVHKGLRIVTTSLARDSYDAGETVEVGFSLKAGATSSVQHACITVVPSGAVDPSAFLYRADSEESVPFHFNFLPETEGTTISGIVMDQNSQVSVPDARIHFSILGEEPAYFVTRSDQEGRFQIKTPERIGDQEMFVVPDYQADHPLEIRIDNDFTSEPLPFHPGSFTLQPDEQILASRMSLHMQLRRSFLADSASDGVISIEEIDPVPFYGVPEISVKVDEFISLPNMEEIIENLIPNTYVMHRGGSTHFMIKSENPMISMFPPLVLMDHIPVFDMDVIMAIPPFKIDHIDVIPDVYVMGEVKFGGIISITSLQGDLGSIKLPEGSYFFDYTDFQASPALPIPWYSGPGKIPDTRNTLFWMDQIELEEDRSLKVSFEAASVPGTYLILFRGVSSHGEIVYGLSQFKIN